MNNFDVLKRMGSRSGKVQLAPLGNIISAKMVKAGTQVTIGVGGNIIHGIMNGEYVGGLILADKAEFEATKSEMEAEASPEILEALKACMALADLGAVPAPVTIDRYKALIAKAERQTAASERRPVGLMDMDPRR